MAEKIAIGRAVSKKEETLERSVWIFQGNPLKYDLYNSLSDENLKEDTWLVSRYRNEMHIGDIALIWKARYASGIYAVGDIVTHPQEMFDLPESRKYWKFQSDRNKKALRVIVRYKLKLKLINALFSKELKKISGLQSMEIFIQPQGTNFRVKSSEWQIISDLLKQKYTFEI